MRRTIPAMALAFSASALSAQGNDRVQFQYTIEVSRGGKVIEASFIKGFETEDGLKLLMKLDRPSYCYVIAGEGRGRFNLIFPEPSEAKVALATPNNTWARLPKTTFIRVGDDPGVERLYLVVAADRIPEFEQAFAKGQVSVPESLALEIRDHYHGEGTYNRDLDKDVVSINYKTRGKRLAVVVEEIALRHR